MALHPNPLSLKFFTGVVESRPDHAAWRREYIGTSLLPTRPVGGYQLTWDVVQSENGLAGIYSLNGRPVPGSDKLFEQRYSEVQNVMASRVLHPTDVAYLREAGELGVSKTGKALLQASQRKAREAIEWCDDTVDATVEYMIMRSLQGSIVWPPKDEDGNDITELMPEWGGVQIAINYPLRSNFSQAATTLTGYNSRTGGAKAWTDTDSDPILDLEVIAQLILKTTGLNAHQSKLIMSADILSYLFDNASILAWIQGTEKGTNHVAAQDMITYIKSKIGYTIQTYDARWTYRTSKTSSEGPTINSVPFLDEGKILIIPAGADPGYLALAPSPDGQYKTGKYVWKVEEEEPPWETRVGCGQVCLPIPVHWDSIFVFDCYS